MKREAYLISVILLSALVFFSFARGPLETLADFATSTNFRMEKGAVTTGGSRATSSNFNSWGSIGQPAVGISSSTNFILRAGFLPFSQPPSVSAVILNNGDPITLTTNATTSVAVNFTIADPDGCKDVFTNGSILAKVYRTGAGSGCADDTKNCYTGTVTANTCTGTNTAGNATATVEIYYFADPTDASSSYASDNWTGYVRAYDSAFLVASAVSSPVELNTLIAIDVTPSAISYGTLVPGTNTSSTNTTSTVKNTGNSSTTLSVSAQSTLVLGVNVVPTSSQSYATSSFIYGTGVTSTPLLGVSALLPGFVLKGPTSTTAVQSTVFWGVEAPYGLPQGNYTGVNLFMSGFTQ